MFPTERQVYHRLRWDPRFDVRRCSVVITLRPSGTERMAFLDFDPEVIPWHRIAELWIDDELAWSRAQRIDRLDELAARSGDTPAPEVTPVAVTSVSPRTPPAALRVVTWNLLHDRHDADLLRSPDRWQDAFDRLAALEADLIALVEVTPRMWDLLRAQPWTRDYAIAYAHGEALLSRDPIRDACTLELLRDRSALCATLATGIGVVVLHLSSDRTGDAALVRSAQITAIAAHVRASPRDAWIIAGDFNMEHVDLLGAIDAWEAARPGEPGHTFDVARNSLAAALTTSGTSRRIDRILAVGFAPRSAALVGVEPGPSGLPPSDHYGVVAELARAAADLQHAPTTRRTALAIVPPVEHWPAIQRVRCAHDRGFGRWPPHVTLAHPFVDEAWLDRAAAQLRERYAAVEPFDVVFDTIAPIEPGSRTIVLLPDRASNRALARLHDAPFRPHLTIAREIDASSIAPFTVRWRVDRVAILVERDSRFAIVDELPLGTARASPMASSTGASADVAAIIARVADAVRAVDPTATVEPFGSIIYAPAYAHDIDLLAVSEAAPADLALALGFSVHGALLRGTVNERAVEVLVGTDDRARAAPRDAAFLVQHLCDHGQYATFLALWPDVLRFVHARALGKNGLGYLGSFGWALLLAIPLCHDNIASLDDWFAWLAALEPGAAIGFSTTSGRAPFWLAAPTPPSRNAARGLTAGTFTVLRAEARRATFTDLAADPPPGDLIAIEGEAAVRGAYEGAFRGMLLDLEASGLVVRPWGRFEACDAGWRHQISVTGGDASAAIAQWIAAQALPVRARNLTRSDE